MTGEILITDNVIDGVDAQNGYGLALFGFSADARVENNTISGVNTSGILVGVHTGQVWVLDNHIAPGPQQAPEYGGGNGIIIGNALGGVAYVKGNTIDCENTWADGILVGASRSYGDIQDRAVIEDNHITMHDSLYGGIGLIGSVENTLVAGNKLEGSAAFALYGLQWLTVSDTVEANTFIGNNISHFQKLDRRRRLRPQHQQEPVHRSRRRCHRSRRRQLDQRLLHRPATDITWPTAEQPRRLLPGRGGGGAPDPRRLTGHDLCHLSSFAGPTRHSAKVTAGRIAASVPNLRFESTATSW